MGSRMPNPLVLVPELAELGGTFAKVFGNGSVPLTTISLVNLRAGQILGNTYATVRNAAALRDAGESEERISSVASWWDGSYFTDAEQAALKLTEAVFQASTASERVSDELFAEVSKHYDDKALTTLVTIIGQAAYSLAFALVGKPVPGVPMAEQWT